MRPGVAARPARLASGLLLRWFARAARRQLQAVGLLQSSRVYSRSSLVWSPGDERVVVLAPHMDDEIIGCGGTLAHHVARGARVSVIFLTDGRQGRAANGSGDAGQTGDIAAVRKREAHAALDELGITDLRFLDAPDGHLRQHAAALGEQLGEILRSLQPDLMYLPCFLEGHPDHRAASELLLAAMTRATPGFDCRAYEVWTPLTPNCFVNIDDTVEAKQRALAHYRSQLLQADYRHSALGLNAYRSSALKGGTCQFAEAFCALPVRQYLALYRLYRSAH